VPGSTYRLQLNSAFTFRDARSIVEYLHDLGITDCYASPILAARPGSAHGYDVCNYAEINPAMGTEKDFARWTDRLEKLNMGLLLDVVPNHMGADLNNPWWRDVLQHGENSKFSHWFDIDWHPQNEGLQGKVLLPILEKPYCKVLEEGKLQVAFRNNGFALLYQDHSFPLSPESVDSLQQEILRLCRENARATEALEDLTALGEVAAGFRSLKAPPKGQSRKTHGSVLAEERARPEVWPALKQALSRFNGRVGVPESFDSLHVLLQQQHYRLAYWRNGNEEINYRRFFDVAGLVALRMELPEVFQATHELVLRLFPQHNVSGLRVDHPDGLWNPKQYFERLQNAWLGLKREQISSEQEHAQPKAGGSTEPQPSMQRTRESKPVLLYVVAEKILNGPEPLPSDWAVAGTTGYDFLNQLNGLFVNISNREALDQIYFEFAGVRCDFRGLVYASKLKILRKNMRSDLLALSRLLEFIAARTRYGLDLSRNELQDALSAVIAAFPIYRTYMTEQSEAPNPNERHFIEKAIEYARVAGSCQRQDALSFVQGLLLLCPPVDLDEVGRQACRQFVMKFQQLTGPVMAKGLEDTAFYNYNRLISLNEVGGNPNRFGISLNSFHQQNRLRAEHWPHSLLTTATHDTKRGEDLRARVNVLSEIPEEWRQAVLKWNRLNVEKKTAVDGQPAPDANDEYFLYQTLIGAWVSEAEQENGEDSFRQRIDNYMLKAIREAKTHTSWTEPNVAYEQATKKFIEGILKHSQTNPFMDDFMLFHRRVAFFGLFNSLSQVVLKMTSPGVPDFYQGTELWDYSLVDPDNRRPVDYRRRMALFSDLREKTTDNPSEIAALIKALLKNHQTGQIKLYLIWRLLELRRRLQSLFEAGNYLPLAALGPKGEHVCAFTREESDDSIITVAARLLLSLTKGAFRAALEPDVWQDTTLAVPGAKAGDLYRNALTQQIVTIRPDGTGLAIRDVLALLPVAVLEKVK
jgi:(1->4)-alpha-D-glucan 1-alpha-D-glucosylmutase